MPTVGAMKQYAEEQYKDGAYTSYIKGKALKIHTFKQRLASISHFLPEHKNKKIQHLDVGCSAGFMIEVGLTLGFNSFGVEFSSEAISHASPQIREKIRHIDINELAREKQSKFDLITGFDIVEHIQDPSSFLKSLSQLLNPGGLLVLTTPDPEHFLAKTMGTRWPMFQPMQHTILFSKRGLKSNLENANFEQIFSGPAFKLLTLEYLADQLKVLNPLISKIMNWLSKVIPKKFYTRPMKLNISEYISVSRAL